MECAICCNEFNKLSRKIVGCLKCGEKVCSTCVKKYLLSTLEDPHCMHCKHAWDLFFLNKILPRNFLSKEWKQSRSNLLYDREKSFFPETMPYVALEIEKEKVHNELLTVEAQIQQLKIKRYQLQGRMATLSHTDQEIPARAQNSFNIRACIQDGCKGFVDAKGLCPVCSHTLCLHCDRAKHKEDDHICDPSDIETWQQIMKSSKPCPNCATRIQKASGCSQMWCPGCHVAFNWNTGAIEKGAIHNPHFYEWAERLGINAAHQNQNAIYQQPCQDRRVWNYYNFIRVVPAQNKVEFRNMHQKLNHIINNDMYEIRAKVERNNRDLRIRFIRNQMDEKKFKKMLISREIQVQKNTRLLEMLDTLNLVIVPLFHNFLEKTISYENVMSNIKNIKQFMDETVDEINHSFHSNIPKYF